MDKEMYRLPEASMPARWKRPKWYVWFTLIVLAAFLIHGIVIGDLNPDRIAKGIPRALNFIEKAFPPDVSRLPQILEATLETFEMALVGTLMGAVLSVPLAVLAARNTSPHPAIYYVTRALISFLRAVPDLVWGLIFLVAIGLGPGTGMLAIMVDVIGFCGRFFAEKIEEIPQGPVDALKVTGAGPVGVVAGAIIPAVTPSMVAISLYAMEHSIRSAVVLGLVGAGGIGVELSTSMKLMQYDTAATVILVVFAVVVAVERTSASIRKRIQ